MRIANVVKYEFSCQLKARAMNSFTIYYNSLRELQCCDISLLLNSIARVLRYCRMEYALLFCFEIYDRLVSF